MATGGDLHDDSAAMFGRPATWPLRASWIPPDGQDPPDWPRPGYPALCHRPAVDPRRTSTAIRFWSI